MRAKGHNADKALGTVHSVSYYGNNLFSLVFFNKTFKNIYVQQNLITENTTTGPRQEFKKKKPERGC